MKKKIETSKVILIFVDTLITLCIIVIFYLKYLGLELSDVTPIFTALIGLAATAHGFYYWKARAENTLKINIQAKKEGIQPIIVNEEDSDV